MTEPSSKTSRIARAINGAIESTVRVSKRFSSGMGRVLVTTTSRAPHSPRRWAAGSENTACVAAMMTSFAPASLRICTAPAIVPPVSIMSSISTQTRPSTSPTTVLDSALFGTVRSRLLCTKPSGTPPRRSAHCSATRTRPVSGETTVTSSPSTLERMWSASSGMANRWSTGPSKKPWIWAVCRSTLITREAPAVLYRSATRRAEIGSRPRPFLSWRAYG